jgi:polar amino acid transport system permease protein
MPGTGQNVRNPWLRKPADWFIFVFRGSPLFIQFFWPTRRWCCCPVRASTFGPDGADQLADQSLGGGADRSVPEHRRLFGRDFLWRTERSIPKGDLEAADAYGLTGWRGSAASNGPPCCGWPGPPIPTRRSFCFMPRRWCSFPAFRHSSRRGDALYYAQYFADKTFNPFVPYPIVAFYFVLLTLALIGVLG